MSLIGLIGPISLISPISPPLISLKNHPGKQFCACRGVFFLKNDCYSDNFP